MLILAADTSGDQLKLGIADEKKIYADYTGEADRTHSEKLIPTLDSMLKESGLTLHMIDSLAVAIGPGSFTGLRVGVSAILGLAATTNKKILASGNPLLEKMFFKSRNENPIMTIHCRAEQFFISEDGENINLLDLEEILRKYNGCTFCGSGAEKLVKQADKVNPEILKLSQPSSYSGGELAEIFAREHQNFQILDPADVDINYLLKSQAERKSELARRHFEVSEMEEKDLPDIIRIEKETFTDDWLLESFQSDITNPDIIAWVIRYDGKCIGYLNCVPVEWYGYISNIAVDRRFHSQGAGRALLDKLKQFLTKMKKNQILLDVRKSNNKAIRFYKKYGFVILMEKSKFYSDPVEDSYTMCLELAS